MPWYKSSSYISIFVAVIALVFGGTKETTSIALDKNNILLTRSRKQAMCAF